MAALASLRRRWDEADLESAKELLVKVQSHKPASGMLETRRWNRPGLRLR